MLAVRLDLLLADLLGYLLLVGHRLLLGDLRTVERLVHVFVGDGRALLQGVHVALGGHAASQPVAEACGATYLAEAVSGAAAMALEAI